MYKSHLRLMEVQREGVHSSFEIDLGERRIRHNLWQGSGVRVVLSDRFKLDKLGDRRKSFHKAVWLAPRKSDLWRMFG